MAEFWNEWRGSLDGRPTMLIKRLLRIGGWRLDLHKFIGRDDLGCFHTHPAHALRIILWGGYVEEVFNFRPDRIFKAWTPGMVGIVKPELSHRVAMVRNGRSSYSLWIRGPVCAEVKLQGDGWAKQKAAA